MQGLIMLMMMDGWMLPKLHNFLSVFNQFCQPNLSKIRQMSVIVL